MTVLTTCTAREEGLLLLVAGGGAPCVPPLTPGSLLSIWLDTMLEMRPCSRLSSQPTMPPEKFCARGEAYQGRVPHTRDVPTVHGEQPTMLKDPMLI